MNAGKRYSPEDLHYRLGPVHTCLYVRACRLVTGTSPQVTSNGRGRRLVELTEGCYREGNSQIVFNPRILGIPVISFQQELYSQSVWGGVVDGM